MSLAQIGKSSRRPYTMAPKTAAWCTTCLMGLILGTLSLVCAAFGYRAEWKTIEQQFEQQARTLHQITTLSLLQDNQDQPEALLRTFYQYEIKRGHFDQLAFVVGENITISHSLDWEGLELGYVLGSPDWQADLLEAKNSGASFWRLNRESNRAEIVLPFSFAGATSPVYLYLSRDLSQIRAQAWARFGSICKLGSLLALAAGAVTYLCLKERITLPLKRLKKRIETRGLEPDINIDGLGDLTELAAALESATGRLLQGEECKISELKSEIKELDEQATLEVDLLQQMVTDLKSSMSAILGYSELLLARDCKQSDRINHIRSIQQEAKRIARLGREIQEFISAWCMTGTGEGGPCRSGGPHRSKELRGLLEKISLARTATIQLPEPNTARSRLEADTPEQSGSDYAANAEGDQAPRRTRLTGSLLILGRRDRLADALLNELNELGLDTVWVPDLSSLGIEVTKETYDVVIVNLTRGDRATMESSRGVRSHFPVGPIIAALPESVRGLGAKFVSVGFDDYLYVGAISSPAFRGHILAVLGKYLGWDTVPGDAVPFEAVSETSLSQSADGQASS